MSAIYHSLASGNFSQDWSDAGLITVNDDWSNVPSIIGYLGNDVVTATAVDPQLATAAGSGEVDVIANQTNPNSLSSGGVAEFALANPTIALNGSGTADAPSIVLFMNATGRQAVNVSYVLRDLDSSGDNATQAVALQYRLNESSPWTNVPAAFVADATTGPNLATAVTPVSVTLPAIVNDAATLQLRIITTNAAGNDEWVGIDDIVVTSEPISVVSPGAFSVADAIVAEGNTGTTEISFQVSRDGGAAGAASVSYAVTLPGGGAGADAADFVAGMPLTGTIAFGDGETSRSITLQIAADTVFEQNETFTVVLSSPTGGTTIADGSATGTITNDDAQPAVQSTVFINEIHYDDVGADAGERVEVAGTAGTSLDGWTLQFYNGSNTPNAAVLYRTTSLSGVIPGQDDGYGTLSFSLPVDGIQNGAFDGIALVNAQGQVVQFLSYEGTITAANGAAAGFTSTDIGVAEEPAVADGFSLQLTGSGARYEDFSWSTASANTFGAVNSGQDFIGADATGLIRIADASVVEGDSGTQSLVFTVTRAGGGNGAGTVDYFLNLTGSVTLDDLAPGTPLSGTLSFAAGETAKQIVIGVVGDTVGEPNETLNVRLANPAGQVAIQDDIATGTIVNDDVQTLAIFDIQGAGHRSGYVGQTVITTGIVTAVDSNGFYLQDAAGDGDFATSDAIFVLTGTAPAVLVGDGVQVRGTVGEFLPGGDASNLTVTQLTAATVTVQSQNNDVPAAVLIGAGGILPPTDTIDDDGFATFDPANDGIDFYEALEGMLVTIDAPLVVSASNSFGETFVVASGGQGATGVNDRGGIAISDGDYNPEKIQIDADSDLFAGYTPDHTQGDRLGNVTGVVSYSFNSYEVLVTEAVSVTEDVTLGRETTTLAGDEDRLSIATFNVENLDPTDAQAKFDLLAGNIVYNLNAPDIIGVQEIQDADGAGSGSNYSGTVTAQKLIDTIAGLGGPNYVYIEIAPTANNTTGGESNGNIRNGFFYDPTRVTYLEGSADLIDSSAYNGSRQPLAASFEFNGETVVAINLHSTSRLGSDPLWGSDQPPVNAGEGSRIAQSQAVRDYVDGLLAVDPALNFAVLGDFNAFYFEESLELLTEGGVLSNLYYKLPEEERYSYLFEGNLQGIDQLLVSSGLYANAQFDAVHINSELTPATPRGTDHDALVATLYIPGNDAPVAGDDAYGTVRNTAFQVSAAALLANDTDADGDPLTITGVSGAQNGTVSLENGTITFTPAEGYSGPARFDYTVSDGNGGTDVGRVTVTVAAGGGTFTGDNGKNVFVAADNGNWTISGLGDNDQLSGAGGADLVDGGSGADTLSGGAGADTLIGGAGQDQLTGGSGADVFRFLLATDGQVGTVKVGRVTTVVDLSDLITDFAQGSDRIDLSAIDARTNVAGDQAFAFIGAGAFTGQSGQLRYEYVDGGANTKLYADVNGDGAADFGLVLQGVFTPQATDFVL